MLRNTILVVAILTALSATAHADETALQPTVQVTASRISETVDSTLADVSVITRQDIDVSGSRDVIDLLRLEAGVDLYRTGGAGSQTSLFLRGSNTNQVLVLIDGVRAASANTGAFAFEQLPLDAVERIEIVRGPRASYWGSDALGGVIQIFTRKLDRPRVAVGFGSYGEADGSAGIGHWNGADGYSVQVGARHVRGFSATNPTICNGPDDPYCSYNADNDGYRNTNLVARGAHALGTQSLSASLYRSQGQAQFDQGYSDVIEQNLGVNLEGDLAPNWSHRLAFGNAREDLATPAYAALYLTRRNSLLWQNEWRLDDHQHVVAGLDLVHDHGETRDTSTGLPQYRDSRDDRALFGGWRATVGALDSEVSLRHDVNSEFGGATTGSLALGWHINDLLRAYANVGQGFRSPTLNEQFSPGYSGYFAGNPELAPERSHSGELGLEFAPDASQRLKANIYSTRVSNLISFSGPQNRAENVARAKVDGAELAYEVSVGMWSLHSTFTWQDPRNEDNGTLLIRRAKEKVSGVLERRFGERFSIGAELLYSSRREDVGDVNLPAYAIVNLRASYQINTNWRFGARLENIADRDYVLVHGYNTPGRSGFVDIVWQPGA
ncbi:MAG: TonB-dependent receptor [Dokdonella sp.]